MKTSNDRRTAAAKGACQDRRRERRPAWVRSWERVHQSLDASDRLINASITEACRSKRHAHRRPVRSSGGLWNASSRLTVASTRLTRAAQALAKASAVIVLDPETAAEATLFLARATERFLHVADTLFMASNEIHELHQDVVAGLTSGELTPERPRERRPRIVLKPRPSFVRAFLTVRRARVADRISALLHRRRRTPRPAAVRVPRRTSQGRAPPFPSI